MLDHTGISENLFKADIRVTVLVKKCSGAIVCWYDIEVSVCLHYVLFLLLCTIHMQAKRCQEFAIDDDTPQYPGSKSVFTEKLDFLKPDEYDGIPVYRVMSRDGEVIDPDQDPGLDKDMVVKMYKTMTTLNTMDKILYESQRQVN